ncbi:hypothetical protein [Cohnella soli]|uniref:Uncharacterized protein n=1 Tax=Cohnella soli TaxID=425005 RepID=A0ABW0HM59_9BACL
MGRNMGTTKMEVVEAIDLHISNCNQVLAMVKGRRLMGRGIAGWLRKNDSIFNNESQLQLMLAAGDYGEAFRVEAIEAIQRSIAFYSSISLAYAA